MWVAARPGTRARSAARAVPPGIISSRRGRCTPRRPSRPRSGILAQRRRGAKRSRSEYMPFINKGLSLSPRLLRVSASLRETPLPSASSVQFRTILKYPFVARWALGRTLPFSFGINHAESPGKAQTAPIFSIRMSDRRRHTRPHLLSSPALPSPRPIGSLKSGTPRHRPRPAGGHPGVPGFPGAAQIRPISIGLLTRNCARFPPRGRRKCKCPSANSTKLSTACALLSRAAPPKPVGEDRQEFSRSGAATRRLEHEYKITCTFIVARLFAASPRRYARNPGPSSRLLDQDAYVLTRTRRPPRGTIQENPAFISCINPDQEVKCP